MKRILLGLISWTILKDFNLDKDIIKKKECVLCGSKKLKKVLDFKKTPLANSYVKSPTIIISFFCASTIPS